MISRTSALSFRDQVRRHQIHTRTGSYSGHEPPDVGAATLTDQDVRGALKGKATRYGALDQPYIVAVNALERFADQDAAVDALFGTPATIDRLGRDGRVTTEHGRLCDGLWHGRTQPQRTGLSGVISMQGVDSWNFARREPRLILNPWAAQPLPPLDLGIRLIQFKDGVRKDAIGSTFGQVFDLPESWPEETADLQS